MKKQADKIIEEPTENYMDSILEAASMENCSPVSTPGVKTRREAGDDEKLGPEEHFVCEGE